MLTAGQIAHFETFGFLVLRQLLTLDEIATIRREADEIFDEERGGAPFTGEAWEQVVPFFERKPFMSTLADDDRIHDLGADLVGPDFILESTAGTLHVGDTSWHGGLLFGDSVPQAKVSIYLDPVAKDTGCLRVIPGSHLVGPSDPFALLRKQTDDPDFRPYGLLPSEISSYSIESWPGDVVVFTEELVHASFGGASGRHRHEFAFLGDPTTHEQVAYIKALYEKANYSLHPAESYVNSDRPRLRRMVSRLVELGFETSKA